MEIKSIVESEANRFPLRDGNIPLDHPVAIAASGKSVGEEFARPLK
jgi:hypothetical protein